MRVRAGKIALLVMVLFSGVSTRVGASLITWNIDSTQSIVRLNLPDQNITVDGITANVRLRNANNSNWSDDGGRASRVTGTLATNYSEGGSSASLTFLQGLHNATAIEFGSFRPNPAAFDSSLVNASNPDGQFANTSGAPAAFAAKIRGNALLTFDLAFLAIRSVEYDASGTATLNGGAGAYSGGASQTNLGVSAGFASIDGLNVGFPINSQLIPDINNQDLGSLLGGQLEVNAGTISIANLGGLDRRLTKLINIPLSFDVDGIIVSGFINGQIVATATVPEPSSVSLLAIGLGLAVARGRRSLQR
jgi:hypothetical protein